MKDTADARKNETKECHQPAATAAIIADPLPNDNDDCSGIDITIASTEVDDDVLLGVYETIALR